MHPFPTDSQVSIPEYLPKPHQHHHQHHQNQPFPSAPFPSSVLLTMLFHTSSWKRRPAKLILPCILLSTFILILYQHFPDSSPPQIAFLHNKNETERSVALSTALSTWHHGPPPQALLQTSAACTPRDATAALLHHFRQTIHQSGVIDIGAHDGYPVTTLALSVSARWVVALEPDARDYALLTRLHIRQNTLYKPIRGTVGETLGETLMPVPHPPEGCTPCVNDSNTPHTLQSVVVHTVDSLVEHFPGDIALLKIANRVDAVMSGSRRLLASGRLHAVLMRFDAEIENHVKTALEMITQAGLRCVILALSGLTQLPFFGEELTIHNFNRFWRFVQAQGSVADVFCLRR